MTTEELLPQLDEWVSENKKRCVLTIACENFGTDCYDVETKFMMKGDTRMLALVLHHILQRDENMQKLMADVSTLEQYMKQLKPNNDEQNLN